MVGGIYAPRPITTAETRRWRVSYVGGDGIGVRPSSGAASTEDADVPAFTTSPSLSDIAAPEDGRTPPGPSPGVTGPLHSERLLIWQLNGSGVRLSHEHGIPGQNLAGRDAHWIWVEIVYPGVAIAMGATPGGAEEIGRAHV